MPEARKLPTDPDERDRVIGKYRLFSKPLMAGANRACRMAKVDELDSHERESGEEAFAALFWQYQAEFDARLLVLLWIVSVAIPRVFDWLDKREAEKKQAAALAGPIPPALPNVAAGGIAA